MGSQSTFTKIKNAAKNLRGVDPKESREQVEAEQASIMEEQDGRGRNDEAVIGAPVNKAVARGEQLQMNKSQTCSMLGLENIASLANPMQLCQCGNTTEEGVPETSAQEQVPPTGGEGNATKEAASGEASRANASKSTKKVVAQSSEVLKLSLIHI